MEKILDGIDSTRFPTGAAILDLYTDRYRQVPIQCGVYRVTRDPSLAPTFLPESKAGWFKGKDPSYSIDVVNAAWVVGASILYIGKAAGASGLRQRIRQLIDFGYGKPIGHSGGRMLWHLSDFSTLRLEWCECPRLEADALETHLIGQFKSVYHARPFANCAK